MLICEVMFEDFETDNTAILRINKIDEVYWVSIIATSYQTEYSTKSLTESYRIFSEHTNKFLSANYDVVELNESLR